MASRDVITVDGWAASGKSALAKGLAQRLGYGHLNSGLLYRAAGFLAVGEGKDLSVSEQVMDVLRRHSIVLDKTEDQSTVVVIDSVARDAELQTPEMSVAASMVSQHQDVRDWFTEMQRSAFAPGGVVAEGRDMGTVIFPDARVRFFVDARLDVRAERRFLQLKGTQQECSFEDIRRALAERDHRDGVRAVAPTKPSEGAVMIDNSDASLSQMLDAMYRVVIGK